MDNKAFFLTGVLEYVAPLESVETSNGSMKRRQFVVRGTDDKGFEVSAVLTAKNALAEHLDRDFPVGQQVTAWFNARAFESRDGRRFNDLSCWRITNNKND